MLNPVLFTEKVITDYLKYQLSTYAFADPDLYAQMRRLLNLEETRHTPLLKGPFVSLSRAFRKGAKVRELITDGVLHPHMANLIPFESVYGHQEKALRSISKGQTTLVSTGTGSGKTECFLYPIISRCLELRDAGAPAGIVAVIVYPMNALAEDQLGRLRDLLAGSEITFGMYVGKTPEYAREVTGRRLSAESSRADYLTELEQARQRGEEHAIHPPEERCSREEMRKAGNQPRILLTNVKQLELLLTRHQDVELFTEARLDYLIFDEAHTFKGAAGAETACLIRRLRAFCGKGAGETTCIATSATLADPDHGPEAACEFASRFFGVPRDEVVLVGEEYEPDLWAVPRTVPRPLPGDAREHLKSVLEAVEAGREAGRLVRMAYRHMTGGNIREAGWEESLYGELAANELVFQIAEALKMPRSLDELLEDLGARISRPVLEEELLAWLALGAAARKQGRPLLRPVIHGFVRGIEGAVITFPDGSARPRLWLSAEDARENSEGTQKTFPLPIQSCTTCGQHYFVHNVKDFTFLDKLPGGGDAVGEARVWPALEKQHGGKRVVLLDRPIAALSEDEVSDDDNNGGGGGDDADAVPRSCAQVWFCRCCGALHDRSLGRCGYCGALGTLVRLLAVRQREKNPGYLTMCISCGAHGRVRPGSYREPARPVRATTVADIHVLAQNMLQHAERKRLLVFSDNRQDAAFQAGWMLDHARRFRLRALMHERILQGPVSVGDLTAYLDDILDRDDELSQGLLPEVWRVHRKEAEGVRHQQERRRFLRIQVLREITMGVKQPIGLEPWGRFRVAYRGLDEGLGFIQEWAPRMSIEPQALTDGIAVLLDHLRRIQLLLDREGKIFSKFWAEGDFEVQRGYLPLMRSVPKGLKLVRGPEDEKGRILQLISAKGDTVTRQAAKHWGVPVEEIETFIRELWRLLTEELELLVPVTLTGSRGRPLPGCSGTRQIDSDKLRLEQHRGVWRCSTCRRVHLRPTPRMACLAWRCAGTIQFEQENTDDYDLMVLDAQFTMLRPKEHSAQVPPTVRENIEHLFKSEDERMNTLVCTPTLELGVDIGALDAVLMRNVPPLPANYWQRAGRAGRRHRMAVNLTYARPVSHDRAYFKEPLKLLQGTVDPPRFNLRNEAMVAKHVHAAVLTALYQHADETGPLGPDDREELAQALRECFPRQIKDYLFDGAGNLRTEPLDVSALATMASKHQARLLNTVKGIFTQGWPDDAAEVVTDVALCGHVLGIRDSLQGVINRIWRRLQWALEQLKRLEDIRRQLGTLDPDQDALRNRCDRFVKKLKGLEKRRRREAEGYDETNTFGVLASEGFLPGYGLEVGSVIAYALVPPFMGLPDFDLPRPTSVALREYVPGNLIYANGNRFVPRFYHLDPRGVRELVRLQVDLANEAIVELGTGSTEQSAGLGASMLRAVPICDVDLPHQSHITDEEDYRFQMAVSVFGKEQGRHGEGKAFSWGIKQVSFRSGVHLRLVNVGAASQVERGQIGYPVCLVCGQSRSPLSSEAERENFAKDHEERCHQKIEPTGFYSDIVADALTIHGCANREEGYSIAETLRLGAAHVLDMEVDDLQVLAIGHPGRESVDMILYDPMPGGSGLLEQLIARWGEVARTAQEIAENCPGACAASCIDCLQMFRNAWYHKHLNRHVVLERVKNWGLSLAFSHAIPPKQATTSADSDEQPVNQAESVLCGMLDRAGFPPYVCQKPIDLGRPLIQTHPDVFFEVPDGRKEGVCIYLDGMSRHLHGNPETAQRDREIREELRSQGYEVIEIPASNLSDPEAMRRTFFRIGQVLVGRDRATEIRENPSWFNSSLRD